MREGKDVERGKPPNTPMSCRHNCGETRGEPYDMDGKPAGYHWRCACPGCGIILRSGW